MMTALSFFPPSSEWAAVGFPPDLFVVFIEIGWRGTRTWRNSSSAIVGSVIPNRPSRGVITEDIFVEAAAAALVVVDVDDAV
jgi:hypothetical protein